MRKAVLRHVALLPVFWAVSIIAAIAQTQASRLGPETAIAIDQAIVDPAFQTTRIDRIAVLPFANTLEVPEASWSTSLSRKLVAQMIQKHPEYTLVAPDEVMNFVSSSKLDDNFNVFLGDYRNNLGADPEFLTMLRERFRIDAVLVGTLRAYGGWVQRGFELPRRGKNFVDIEMKLYRTSDKRQIWSGNHFAAGESDVAQAADAIGDVFARFLGRMKY